MPDITTAIIAGAAGLFGAFINSRMQIKKSKLEIKERENNASKELFNKDLISNGITQVLEYLEQCNHLGNKQISEGTGINEWKRLKYPSNAILKLDGTYGTSLKNQLSAIQKEFHSCFEGSTLNELILEKIQNKIILLHILKKAQLGRKKISWMKLKYIRTIEAKKYWH